MGEDGTMIVLPHSDSPKMTAVARASDAESSERDHEVHEGFTSVILSLCFVSSSCT